MQINYRDNQQHKSPDQLRRDKLQLKMKILRADLAPGVVKYMMKPKNDQSMQVPLHNVEYHHFHPKQKVNFSRTLQKMNFDPLLQLDEIREEKWSILSRNCKKILEKSRISLGKPVGNSLFRRSSIDQGTSTQKVLPNKFLSRRQSIELRASEIQSPQMSPDKAIEKQILPEFIVPEIKTDPYYNKFKKYYQKIGISKVEQPQLQNQKIKKIGTSNQQERNLKIFSPQSMSQQQYFFPTLQCSPKLTYSAKNKSTQSQYLEEISAIFYKAQNFQDEIKKDETENYGHLSKKVDSIRSELNKLHKIINNEDSNENIEIK